MKSADVLVYGTALAAATVDTVGVVLEASKNHWLEAVSGLILMGVLAKLTDSYAKSRQSIEEVK